MKIVKFLALILVFAMLISTVSVLAVDYERGDLDKSGEVDSKDAVYLLYHVFFPEDYAVSEDCDYNGNGSVDANDAIYLLYHVFFPEDYPLGEKEVVGNLPVEKDTEGGKYGPFIPLK